MKYTLKSFSQDVHLSSPDESQHFLVFDREDGTEFRIPVPQETIIALTKNTLAYEAKKSVVKEAEAEQSREPIEEEPLEEATEFGGFGGDDDTRISPEEDLADLEPESGILAVSPTVMRKATQVRRQAPQTEEEVPSL